MITQLMLKTYCKMIDKSFYKTMKIDPLDSIQGRPLLKAQGLLYYHFLSETTKFNRVYAKFISFYCLNIIIIHYDIKLFVSH